MEERFLKLTNTAYKVLEFFPEADPLKNKAKEKVLAIMENLPLCLATDGWASLQKEKASSQLLVDLDLFLSYLKLAKAQRWIDDINFLILVKEYESLKREIPKQDFTEIYASSLRGVAGDACLPAGRKQSRNYEIATPSPIGSARNDEYVERDLTERQKKIMEMLNEKEKAQVSDIIKVLPNITKRTIRRDLDGLLQMGKIVRVGEWNQVFYKSNNDRTIILS